MSSNNNELKDFIQISRKSRKVCFSNLSKIVKNRKRKPVFGRRKNSVEEQTPLIRPYYKDEKIDDEDIKDENMDENEQDSFADFPSISHSSSELKLRNCYQQGLLNHYGISYIDNMFQVFVINDFNTTTQTLMHDSHNAVKRRVFQFEDSVEWIYACTCNISHFTLISSLNQEINQIFSDFQGTTCLHIDVIKDVLSKQDLENDINPEDYKYDLPKVKEHPYCSPEKDLHLYPLPGDCVCHYHGITGTYGVNNVCNKQLRCTICKSSTCPHVVYVKGFNKPQNGIVPDILQPIFAKLLLSCSTLPKYVTPKPISQSKVNFIRTPEMIVSFNRLKEKLMQVPPLVFKATGKCNACGIEMLGSNFELSDDCCIIFTEREIHYCKGRRLLRKYSSNQSLALEEFQEMIECLRERNDELANFIVEVDNGNRVSPDGCRRFLFSLSCQSPLVVLFPRQKAFRASINKYLNGCNIKSTMDWTCIQHSSPILFQLLNCGNHLVPIPTFMKHLINDLLVKADKPFNDKLSHPDSHSECIEQELTFFPSMPVQRGRGRLVADSRKEPRKDKICKKQFRGHPSLLPGIFTMFCEHAVCYGFQIMKLHESVNVPFTLFRKRFIKAPEVVIYDLACALHRYCLNRDPTFFQDTKFMVDRFHWFNHRGCSKGYELNIYPAYKKINSQINEQANSGLKRIEDQLSYMTADNFMRHCSLYLLNRNMEVNVKNR